MSVNVKVVSAVTALESDWNLQPSFQRSTQPSKSLISAMKTSARNQSLVFPVMLRNGSEVGDGRKRMLVLKQWEAFEKNPPKGEFSSDYTKLLEGTQVIVCDYDLPLTDFLVEFEAHNQINERMSAGELLNAEFHGFPEDLQQRIASNRVIRQSKRLSGLSFLGYLLTGCEFNARAAEVMEKVKKLEGVVSTHSLTQALELIDKSSNLGEQIAFAVKNDKGIRKPTSKSDQAVLLRLIQTFDTENIRGEFEKLREGWIEYVKTTQTEAQRESTGDSYSTLAKCFGLSAKKPAGSSGKEKQEAGRGKRKA
jgi:hypothetical protein